MENTQKAIKHFKNFLKQRKHRLTKQRAAIAARFLAKEGHICTDELYYMLRREYPHIGYATVYRTLKLLKKAQLASEVNFTGKRRRFEHLFEHPRHDHFVCIKCKKVIEFADPEIERTQEMLSKKYKFKGQSIQVFGLCHLCSRKEKKL